MGGTLAGKTIASTYQDLLTLNSASDNDGITSGLVKVEDGDGTDTALYLSTVAIAVDATDKIHFDGGNDTYIYESAGDVLDIYVGGNNLLKLSELGGGGNDRVQVPNNVKFLIGNSDTYFKENPDDHLYLFVGSSQMMLWDQDETGGGNGTIEIGVDGNGCDVKFYAEAASSYTLYDQSAMSIIMNDQGHCDAGKFQIDITGNIGDASCAMAAAISLESNKPARGKGIFFSNTTADDGSTDNKVWFIGNPYQDQQSGAVSRFQIGYHDNATDQPHYKAQGIMSVYANAGTGGAKNGMVGINLAASNATYACDFQENEAYDAGTSHTGWVMRLLNDGDNANRYGLRMVCGADNGAGETIYLSACDGDGNEIGSIRHNAVGGTFAVVETSDERLKKDIVDTSIAGLTTINGLKVRDFKWKKNDDFVKGGFIAQEVITVMPEVVSGTDGEVYDKPSEHPNEDGTFNVTKDVVKPMGVSQTNMIPALVKAVQELSAKVTALENA